MEFLISLSINFHIPSANNETGTRKSSADLYKFFLNLFQENALTWSGYLKRSFWPKTTFTAPERFWIFSNETFPLLTSERRGKRLKQGSCSWKLVAITYYCFLRRKWICPRPKILWHSQTWELINLIPGEPRVYKQFYVLFFIFTAQLTLTQLSEWRFCDKKYLYRFFVEKYFPFRLRDTKRKEFLHIT